jgi:enoyl-CoA hydratase
MIERLGAVTTVVIDRPEARNAIDRATAQALAEAFREFDADPAQHVAVLCGANGHFCAGADLKAFVANPGEWSLSEDGDAPLGPTRMLLSKPVIAAVSGYAVAGGLELALWCDLRVVEQTATFGVFCRRWGVPLIDGGTIRLSRLIGHSRALDMILTGRAVGAEEALAIGLANRVVPTAKRARRPRNWRRRSPPSRRPACATTGCRATSNGACRWRGAEERMPPRPDFAGQRRRRIRRRPLQRRRGGTPWPLLGDPLA